MKPPRPTIRKGGTYPPEFREEAVRYWLSSSQTLNAVASDLGLTPESLRVWRRQMEQMEAAPARAGEAVVEGKSTQDLALAREVGQLRRELEAMTRQRDILKKAISIFSEAVLELCFRVVGSRIKPLARHIGT